MTIVSEKRSANAVGGKTARPCDSCLRRRARWYCAADDAFLCQGCDTTVHSANPLARRHLRVRLKTASSSCSSASSPLPSSKLASAAADAAAPSWHQGFKRKARTPRPHQAAKPAVQHVAAPPVAAKSEPLVPDFEATSLDENAEEEEEQLLYRVPIFDPVYAEFCSSHVSDDSTATTSSAAGPPTTREAKLANELPKYASSPVAFVNTLPGFSPSDVDIGDFAADVESLLGRGLDEDAFCMEGLGLMEMGDDVDADCCLGGSGDVKLETADGDDPNVGSELVSARMATNGETLDMNFDCGSPTAGENADEEETKVTPAAAGSDRCGDAAIVGGLAKRRKIMLRLDYEAIINAWSTTQGCSSPWTDGERPQLNTDDCWQVYMGMWGEAPGVVYGGGSDGGEVGGCDSSVDGGAQGAAGDGGREARVSRYREKRRTRLFSKKIRYEVRKLNAEKRPRMKGRFVKSTSFVGAAAGGGGVGVRVAVGVAPPPAYAF